MIDQLTAVRKRHTIQAMEYIEERALNLYLAQNQDARLFPPHMILQSLRGTLFFEYMKVGIAVDDLKKAIKQSLLEIKHSVINAWKGRK